MMLPRTGWRLEDDDLDDWDEDEDDLEHGDDDEEDEEDDDEDEEVWQVQRRLGSSQPRAPSGGASLATLLP